MIKRFGLAVLAVAFCATTSMAQQITPIWEFLITGDDSPLPILKKNEPTGGETSDGTDVYDSYGGLKRYDDTRLLLLVRENGINETDANHDAALAAAYPDRSLIWIDSFTGEPMGVALEIGLTPVALDPALASAGGSTIDYYMAFGVGDDGVIYSGHKNQLFKYEPNGDGTFGAPQVIYVHPNDGTDTWSAWRWETIKVSGSGTDTVILAGGKTWRSNQFTYYFTTTDGESFSPVTSAIGFRGGNSSAYMNEAGDEIYVIGGNFPGGASGFGVDIRREFTNPQFTEPFIRDELFTFTAPAVDVEAQNFLNTYIGWFHSGFDAKTELPYFAVYSCPSWDTKDPGTAGSLGFADDAANTPYLPGWLALHDAVTGEYIEGSSHMLPVYENTELDGDTIDGAQPSSRWHATLGDVQLNTLPNAAAGASELLWYSGVFGYGRYAIGDIGETNVPNWSLY